jgi:homoserine O-acetyltransferase
MLMKRADFLDFEVPLPADLHHLGRSVRATATGGPEGPVVVALGGISGNRFVCPRADGSRGWWTGLAGEGCALDPATYRVLGLDFAADLSGKTAPTTADQARVVRAALDAIDCAEALAIVGASYGGMVALRFAELFPDRVRKLVIISAGAEPHPAATAARELQRRVVALGIESGRGEDALSIARGLAMLTYRTAEEFAERFNGGIVEEDPLGPSEPGAYLRARGQAFASVMSPERFLSLSASIDRHRADPAKVHSECLLIGADTDLLVPPAQMRALQAALPGSPELHLRDCLFGHDMFLKEAPELGRLIAPFLAS